MKFALFILASWTENAAAHQRRIYQEALEQVRYAEAPGFDSVWIAEHHSSRYGIFPSLMPILAHIAAQTKTIRWVPASACFPSIILSAWPRRRRW